MHVRKITALRKQRGFLYAVECDGEETVSVDRRTADERGVCEGMTFTEDEWEDLLAASAANRARERALWLLSRRDHSARELERKLYTVTDHDGAAATVRRMIELGLVDDERYAERLARELCLTRQLPIRRAAQKMAEKGLPREVIGEALAKLDADDVRQALAHLKKMCYTDTVDADRRRKIAEKLIRKGFSYDTVKQAIRRLEEGED